MGADAEADRLGRAIMSLRTALGMKRKDLALASGLSYPYLAELENGSKTPSGRALQAIAHALQLSPAELLLRAEEMPDVDAAAHAPSSAADTPKSNSAISTSQDEEIVLRVVQRVAALVEEDLRKRLEYDLPALVREEMRRSRGRRP